MQGFQWFRNHRRHPQPYEQRQSQVESVQTFVTEVDRSGISAILAQGGPPNPRGLALRQSDSSQVKT